MQAEIRWNSVGFAGTQYGPHRGLRSDHRLNIACLASVHRRAGCRGLAANHLNSKGSNDEGSNESSSDGDRTARDLAGGGAEGHPLN